MLVTYPARRSFDRSFDRTFAQLAAFAAPRPVRSFGPTVSGSWTDEGYQFIVDLPGVPEEDVAVSVTGRTVTIDVTSSEGTGSWSRTVRLPQTLDPEQVGARYLNGRLTVTVGRTPQPPAPEARRIVLDTTPAQPALETTTSADAQPAEPDSDQSENGEGTNVSG